MTRDRRIRLPSKKAGEWYQITAPHFCAGLRVDDGVVREAAPIIRWAVGRTWPQLTHYLRHKRWRWERIDA